MRLKCLTPECCVLLLTPRQIRRIRIQSQIRARLARARAGVVGQRTSGLKPRKGRERGRGKGEEKRKRNSTHCHHHRPFSTPQRQAAPAFSTPGPGYTRQTRWNRLMFARPVEREKPFLPRICSWPLDAVACDLLCMLTCAVLTTSSQSKAAVVRTPWLNKKQTVKIEGTKTAGDGNADAIAYANQLLAGHRESGGGGGGGGGSGQATGLALELNAAAMSASSYGDGDRGAYTKDAVPISELHMRKEKGKDTVGTS